MSANTLSLCFPDRAALEQEYAANLKHARAFVPGACGLEVFAPCTLVLKHPSDGRELSIRGQVVMVREEEPQRGVAVQFEDRSEAALATLASFVEQESSPGAPSEQDERALVAEDARSELAGQLERVAQPEQLEQGALVEGTAEAEPGASLDPGQHAQEHAEERVGDDDIGAEDGLADEHDSDAPPGSSRPPVDALSKARQQRLRNITPGERIKVAQGPVLEDRVLLERIYGTTVWELLLRNPRITIPEVARIARKGTVPRPLLELIVDNEHWIRQSVVRRALLSNPRLSADSASKVLRTMSARELKLVPQQTAYPAIVRQAAQRLMRGA